MIDEKMVADTLRRAAEIHMERGGCKGSYVSPEGRVCLLGAVKVAMGFEPYASLGMGSTYWDISRLLGERLAGDAVYWNDLPETSDLDVQKFLLSTADQVEFGVSEGGSFGRSEGESPEDGAA